MSAPLWTISPGRTLMLDRPRLIGIVNVTPDSFSDGGELPTADAAVERALRLLEDGADAIDVGGESTRPGATCVEADEQIRRTAPVIERLRAATDAPICIDTTRSDVARAALDAGADVVNDVSAGSEDPALLELVAARGGGLVLMHRRLPPERDDYSDRYAEDPVDADVTATVRDVLAARAEAARAAGVARGCIVLDPGLGFGKSVPQNFALIRETGRLIALGYPLLSAASRKSFLGAVTGETEPRRRVPASVAVSVAHWLSGVRLFRVHDVAAHRQALETAAAISLLRPPAGRATIRTGPGGPPES